MLLKSLMSSSLFSLSASRSKLAPQTNFSLIRLLPQSMIKISGNYSLSEGFQISRLISTTSIAYAEPLKKKKKIDPAIIRAREERKRKKIERQIRKLEKSERQLKQLDENEVPTCLIDDPAKRARNLPQLPTEIADARWILVKEWGAYKSTQVRKEAQFFNQMKQSQDRALAELQKLSPNLYEEAIKIDRDFIPYKVKGPTETPPIENYKCPEGDYFDVSKKWE